MLRAARLGDGWMPSLPADQAEEKVSAFHAALRTEGRDPTDAGVENMVLLGTTVGGPVRTAEDAAADAAAWRKAGAVGVNIHTMAMGLEGPDAHLAIYQRIADLLGLRSPD